MAQTYCAIRLFLDIIDGRHAHAIGIHSGMMASVEEELVGDTPSLARGCQQLAEPGSVWVTGDTERLVHEYFDCQVVGQQPLARSGRPTPVYRVEEKNDTRNRLDHLANAQRLTPFVGHAHEMKQLAACLGELHRGQGRVITLCGEPGIGKSRLVWELQRLDHQCFTWLESSCSPYFQNTGLYPLISLLEQLLDFQPGDDAGSRRVKLDDTLERLGLQQPAMAWHLALLLRLPSDTPAPQTITEDQRERMRTAFVALIGRLAARQPLVLVIEDLHWADPSTVAWLDASLDALASARCLVLLTYRPTLTPPWRPRLIELSLAPLSFEQVERLVDGLVGDVPVSDQIRHRVAAQADGIPLFAEELARAVFESRERAVENEIPSTLRDSLWARLDRVGAAKTTAGWAAALGREFAYPMLAAIVPFDEPRVQADLAALTAAGLIQPVGDAAAARYVFRHALIQEAAHGSLLKRTRQAHHRQIAQTYVARFPQVAEAQPEVMAEHYDQAGMTAQAVDCWLEAGERAMTQGATSEAFVFFDRALGAIEPEDRERCWRALWGRETVLFFRGERLAQKADIEALLALAECLDDDAHRAQAQIRRARYASSLSDYHEQAEAADAAVAAARRADRPTLEVEALAYKVAALMRLGARTALPQVVAQTLAQAQQIDDDGVRSYAMAAVALYHLEEGDLAHAAHILSRSLDAARHARSRRLDLESQYHGHLGFAYVQLGLYAKARDTLETGLELANVIGIGRYRTYPMLNLGFVHWRIGDLDTAVRMEETALQDYLATGEAFGQAACRAYLGYMYEELGDLAAAANYLAEARIGFAELDVALDRIEAQATEARVLLAQGHQEAARQLTEDVCRSLREQETEGLASSAWATMCVVDVLDRVEIPGIHAAGNPRLPPNRPADCHWPFLGQYDHHASGGSSAAALCGGWPGQYAVGAGQHEKTAGLCPASLAAAVPILLHRTSHSRSCRVDTSAHWRLPARCRILCSKLSARRS